ncbi:MAG: IgGFc-binding protein [Candidatus Azobacteroides sp.]|nr:IgGFc-binding protein [Candidatus Azobacteroides sp.]
MTKKRIKKVFFLLLLFSCTAIHSLAQSDASGKEFYVAFGRNHMETSVNDGNVELILRITARVDTKVKLSFTENHSLDTSFDVPGGTIRDYILTRAQAVASYSGNMTWYQTKKKSIRVTATEPIILVMTNSANHSVEASRVWPVESWGTEYYSMGLSYYYYSSMYPDNNSFDNCNGYILIAKEDNTQIILYNTASGTENTTLNAGEIYYYHYPNANSMGTRIVSDKPIAFIQTNSQAAIYSAGPNPIPYNNYNLEQLPPTNQWGTKFIAPANNTGDDTESDYYAGFFRVFAKENTTITVRFTNNLVKTYTIAANRYADIILNIENLNGNTEPKNTSNACYITSNKPVGICSIHTQKKLGTWLSQPAIAWLPPLEQKTHNVLMSPLDFNSRHVYLEMHHFCTVIVPTANKENTTVSINGGPVLPIQNLPEFQWIANNIGGSGYSVGRYYLGASNKSGCGSNCKLNTTVLIDNPDGLIMLVYGHGGYTKYFYNAGSAFRDLEASFTVNGDAYYDMDGKAYCNTSDFIFKADPDTLTRIVWKLNGTEIPGSRNKITAKANDLPDGHYTVEMLVRNKTYTTHFYVGGSPVIWTPEANTGGTNEQKQNWNIRANWTPALVPTSCHTVYIPGNSTHYPKLTGQVACHDIYFIHGAELGRPDLLAYKKAHVQLNFDLKQSAQQKKNDKDLILKGTNTWDRMRFSADASAGPLSRERWHMLSSPLQGVVTGDLSFGGFPLTFLMKFGPVEKDGTNYSVGKWTTTYTSLIEPVTTNPTDGFAFYMYGYGINGNNTGCEESGSFGRLNESNYFPNRSGKDYGIKETNGILELPFFKDSTLLYSHRTQVYNPASNTSVFYSVNDGKNNSADFNKLMETNVSVTRKADNGNYRFAPEKDEAGSRKFQKIIHHPVNNLKDGDEFLAGNPYMSSIDMVRFLEDNVSSVDPSFRIWNGKISDFITCKYNKQTGKIISSDGSDMRYTAPFQGFFLKYKGTGNVSFNVETISTVRPAGSSFNLRSDQETRGENILRIKAENQFAASHAAIGYKEGASNGYVRGEDVQKLFSPYNYVPSVYSLADDVPVAINFINGAGEIIIPLGIKTEYTGKIKLTFTGMNNYTKASKIELIDALEGRTIDLTGKSSETYSFDNTKKGIQNGRFLLRIGTSMTGLPNIAGSDNLKIYGDSKGIFVISSPSDPVLQVIVYDFQGRKVFESASGAQYYPLQENIAHSSLIIKVITKNQAKTAKINY